MPQDKVLYRFPTHPSISIIRKCQQI